MVDVGDTAPDFTVPLADGDIRPFTLSDHLDEAPLILAFYPGAFTSVCTSEMCTFADRLSVFDDIGATVYGVSVDTPYSLNEFREREGLGFGMLSDHEKEVVEDYGLRIDFEDIGYYGLAQRAVYVVDEDRTVTWRWVADDPEQEPDYEAVEAAAREAT